MLQAQLKVCNAQREDAESKLSLARQQLEYMEEAIPRLEAQRDKAEATASTTRRELEVMTANRDDYAKRLNIALKAPVTRNQLEGLSRERLVSLIEEAINEARRKGLVEAEGLLSRHRELTNETDLEMMRGVVRTYQDRIAQVEEQRTRNHKAATTPVKLDTRPLAEKMKPAGFRAPDWWFNETGNFEVRSPASVVYQTPKPPTPTGSFGEWSKAADTIESNAKYSKLGVGGTVTVPGTSGGTYILTRHPDLLGIPHLSCSCPSWRFQKNDTRRRTCKHLMGYFGNGAELERVTKPLVTAHCWCGKSLVRGQCPEHTRDWKGEELCACGRKFASCKAAFDTLSVAQRRLGHQPELTASQNPDAHRRIDQEQPGAR